MKKQTVTCNGCESPQELYSPEVLELPGMKSDFEHNGFTTGGKANREVQNA